MQTLLTLTLSGSALALLLLALRYLVLRRMPSTVYYYAWLRVLLRFALPLPGLLPTTAFAEEAAPVAAVQSSFEETQRPSIRPAQPVVPTLAEDRAEEDKASSAEKAVSVPAPVQKPAPRIDWRSPELWLTVWGIGTALSFGATVCAYLRFTIRLRRTLRRPDRSVREVYASIPGRKPSLYRSAAVRTPMMYGVFAPRIVLPEREYDEELLLNILRHELTHYRRHDTLYKWFAAAVLSAHWFNPLSWIIRRELGRACELSCDEMLLRSMTRGEKQSYGNTLLSMAASSALPAGVVATTFATEKRDLKERLEQIMHYKKSGARILAAVLAVALLAGCGMAAGPQAKEPAAEPALPDDAVLVTNVDELLAAIAPNTTIRLAAGEYDLSAAADYGQDTHSSRYSWNGVWSSEDGETAAELVIHNVEGLTLLGEGPDETTIAAVPRYANVIRFVSCPGLTVANLTAGHTREPGYCSGGVLRLESCEDARIEACGLFGCGTIGVSAMDCSGLSVTSCDIYECSYNAVYADRCRDLRVQDCDIRDHGRREGQGEAMSLFTADYSEGFTVYNCRVHDNRAQYLLNGSFTKNLLFLSNDVTDNAFGSHVFTFQQYGATVDGCRFEGNDVSGGWYSGSGVYAADIEGNALAEGAQLAEMQLRDIPPERVAPKPAELAPTAEVPVGGQISVKTVDEFLASIGPDRSIILDGPLFDLSTASNYGGIGTEYYYWQKSPDGPALVIHDVSGLSIQAKDSASGATTLAAIPRYADVLSFHSCDDLFLGGFTAGHTTEPGVCSGGVLNFQNCHQVTVEKMRLYGCGILGVQSSSCTSLSLLRTEIYECSQGAGVFFQTDGITFIDCNVHDVPSPAFVFNQCGDKSWNGTPIEGLDSMYDVDESGALAAYELPHAEEDEYHGGVEDLENPFAGEPEFTFGADTPQGKFAAAIQQAVVDGDWAALADRIKYPLQFFTDHYSFVIHDRDEYLKMVDDGYFSSPFFEETFDFTRQIAEADPSVFGSCVFGWTCLDGRFAFANLGFDDSLDDLRIGAISVLTPLWPGHPSDGGYVQAVPPTPQP